MYQSRKTILYHLSETDMSYLTIPLDIKAQRLRREENIKQSIDESLNLILTTPQYTTPADLQFGFVFFNLRFEILNENEGVVYNSEEGDEVHGITGLYDRKISGSSRNLNTFAAELKDVINTYEKRLGDVTATMTYIREERRIYVTVKGVILSTKEPYTYTTTIKVWK